MEDRGVVTHKRAGEAGRPPARGYKRVLSINVSARLVVHQALLQPITPPPTMTTRRGERGEGGMTRTRRDATHKANGCVLYASTAGKAFKCHEYSGDCSDNASALVVTILHTIWDLTPHPGVLLCLHSTLN